jgi:hypothetical protein
MSGVSLAPQSLDARLEIPAGHPAGVSFYFFVGGRLRHSHLYGARERLGSLRFNERRRPMDQSRSGSSLPCGYDPFLFAPVCKEFNGAPLSVLSVLARMDLDPWDEAARLGAMPQASAKSTLASMLNRVPGGRWSALEVDRIAAHLVRLLPDGSKKNTRKNTHKSTQTVTAAARTPFSKYWLILLTLALVASFLAPHGQVVDAPASTSSSAQTSAAGDGAVSIVPAESRPSSSEMFGPQTRASGR